MAVVHDDGTVYAYREESGNLTICVKNDRLVGSRGIWFDSPFNYVLPVTLLQIFLAVCISRLLHFVLRPIKTPTFVCNVLGGILMGPSFIGHNRIYRNILYAPRQAEFLSTAASIGALYSIFIVSLKMDLGLTVRAAKRRWRLGLYPFLFSFVATYVLFSQPTIQALATHFRSRSSILFFCFSSAFSNFPVISDALLELNLINSELGQIALSSAMISDLLHLLGITAMYMLKHNGKYALQFVSSYMLLVFSCFFLLRPLVYKFLQGLPVGKPLRRSCVVMILVGVLVMAAISDTLGVSYLQGPLLFGLCLPTGPPLASTVVEKSELIVSQVLLPLFFTFIGIRVDLFAIWNWELLAKFQLVMIAGYLAKVLACMLVSPTYNIKLKNGLMLGLILNIKGIIEVLTFIQFETAKLIDEEIFNHLVVFALGTTAVVSPLIEILYKPHTRVESKSHHNQILATIQNTPGNSELGIITCVYHEENVRSLIGLLEVCNPKRSSPICAYVTHFIELLGKSTPSLMPFTKHRRGEMSAKYDNTSHIMRAFENYSDNSHGPVTILPYINVAPYKNMHESICNLAQDRLIPFIIIPFHENQKSTAGSHAMSSSIRDVNTNFLDYATCSVGIFVDRDSQLHKNIFESSFHVGIFFIGGEDDREALALAARMSEHPSICITLFQFILPDERLVVKKVDENEDRQRVEEARSEILMDEGFIDEFKAKNIGNDNVVYCEIEVEDGVAILEVIRRVQGNFNLVMVGRRHNIGALKDEEMTKFIVDAEMLGMFGDMLASSEFCNGMVPVLVMQCGGRPRVEVDRIWSVSTSFAGKQ